MKPNSTVNAAVRAAVTMEAEEEARRISGFRQPPTAKQRCATDEHSEWRNKGLTGLEQRFCEEYLVDLVGTDAYLRARPKVKRNTARAEASTLLAMPHICAEIQRLINERSIRTGITIDRLLVRLWEMATVSHRELVDPRVGCCRYCWGTLNRRQRTKAEFNSDKLNHVRNEQERRKAGNQNFVPSPFNEEGGVGFDANVPPNPSCAECFGDGLARPLIKDARTFSKAANALYAGIRIKDGAVVEVKTHDQTALLQLVGRHLGMWNEKVAVTAAKIDPLTELIRQIARSNARSAATGVVHKDPERSEFDSARRESQP